MSQPYYTVHIIFKNNNFTNHCLFFSIGYYFTKYILTKIVYFSIMNIYNILKCKFLPIFSKIFHILLLVFTVNIHFLFVVKQFPQNIVYLAAIKYLAALYVFTSFIKVFIVFAASNFIVYSGSVRTKLDSYSGIIN